MASSGRIDAYVVATGRILLHEPARKIKAPPTVFTANVIITISVASLDTDSQH